MIYTSSDVAAADRDRRRIEGLVRKSSRYTEDGPRTARKSGRKPRKPRDRPKRPPPSLTRTPDGQGWTLVPCPVPEDSRPILGRRRTGECPADTSPESQSRRAKKRWHGCANIDLWSRDLVIVELSLLGLGPMSISKSVPRRLGRTPDVGVTSQRCGQIRDKMARLALSSRSQDLWEMWRRGYGIQKAADEKGVSYKEAERRVELVELFRKCGIRHESDLPWNRKRSGGRSSGKRPRQSKPQVKTRFRPYRKGWRSTHPVATKMRRAAAWGCSQSLRRRPVRGRKCQRLLMGESCSEVTLISGLSLQRGCGGRSASPTAPRRPTYSQKSGSILTPDHARRSKKPPPPPRVRGDPAYGSISSPELERP